jgi:hypothetical protein
MPIGPQPPRVGSAVSAVRRRRIYRSRACERSRRRTAGWQGRRSASARRSRDMTGGRTAHRPRSRGSRRTRGGWRPPPGGGVAHGAVLHLRLHRLRCLRGRSRPRAAGPHRPVHQRVRQPPRVQPAVAAADHVQLGPGKGSSAQRSSSSSPPSTAAHGGGESSRCPCSTGVRPLARPRGPDHASGRGFGPSRTGEHGHTRSFGTCAGGTCAGGVIPKLEQLGRDLIGARIRLPVSGPA